jgi:hypothetical protein
MGAAHNRQAERSLFLGLDHLSRSAATGSCGLVLSSLYAAELFGVCKNQIHVLLWLATNKPLCWQAYLVERQHLADHRTPVIQRNAHAVVDL